MKYMMVLLVACVTALPIHAQVRTLEQRYVPLVLAEHQPPLLGIEYARWTAYKFDLAQKRWTAVPFQVDEVKESGYIRNDNEKNGVIDAQDELLFLSDDLGDRAGASQWLDDPASRSAARIEIELTDPLDPAKKGWVYLYQKLSNPPDVAGYISYIPAPSSKPASDSVKTAGYKIGYNQVGWMDYLSLAPGYGADLVDRLKLRLAGESVIPSIGAYVITEEAIQARTDAKEGFVSYYPGKIRGFRDTRGKIVFPPNFIFKELNADPKYQYFPFSYEVESTETALNESQLALFGLKNLRQSLDLSAIGKGMTFYSARNPGGFAIDGQPDAPDLTLDQLADRHWVMASGSQGTIFLILEIPEIPNAAKLIYYHDNQDGSTADETPDTGDLVSYGDMGLALTTEEAALKTNKISMKLTVYFIPQGNQNASLGASLFQWQNNALLPTVTTQAFDPSAVGQRPVAPSDYEISPAYPNPFRTGSGEIRFEIHAPMTAERFDLVIYNSIGQEIRRLEGAALQNGHPIRMLWDGADRSGRAVAPGIYFYRIQGRVNSKIYKLVVLP